MPHSYTPERLEALYAVLLEIAGGNFTVRLAFADEAQEFDALVALVNMVAESLQTRLFCHGSIRMPYACQYLVAHVFVLDLDFRICGLGAQTCQYLGYPSATLCGAPFSNLLDTGSLGTWEALQEKALDEAVFQDTVSLCFKTEAGYLIPLACLVARLVDQPYVIVSAVAPMVADYGSLHPIVAVDSRNSTKTAKAYDAALFQRLYDFILGHLDAPLPTVQALAVQFGTNDYTLKAGFRHFFNTSIYQLYQEERLKRAHFLIQQTDMPLKNIAYMCGFNIYSNFSKAFKKQFSLSPNLVARGIGGSATLIDPETSSV